MTSSSPSIWQLLHNAKLTVKISSIFVAFLEKTNFILLSSSSNQYESQISRFFFWRNTLSFYLIFTLTFTVHKNKSTNFILGGKNPNSCLVKSATRISWARYLFWFSLIFYQNWNATLKRIWQHCEHTAAAFKWLRIIMQIFFTCHIDPDVSCTIDTI